MHSPNLVRIADGKVTVFLRELKRKPVYYARYKVDKKELANNQRYITESLETDSIDKAIELALRHLAKLEIQQESGITLKHHTVSQAIAKYITQYEDGVTNKLANYTLPMLRGLRTSLRAYWDPYIGGHTLNTLTHKQLEGYERWRREGARTAKERNVKNRKAELANSTIEWEVNAFRQFLRWCTQQGLYTGRAQDWTYSAGKRERRSGLTLQQYVTLTRYMDSPQFLSTGNPADRDEHVWHRRMLKAYIHLLCNTGMRPGEVRYLQYKDYEIRINSQGKRVPIIHISANKSKWGKTRQAVARAKVLYYMSEWRVFREVACGSIKEDAYIFCDTKGKTFNNLLEGVQNILREAGVDKDSDGNTYVIYSFRHAYIQWHIQHSKQLDIYKLAQNCGTSVAQIENYYSDVRQQSFVDDFS